MNTPPIPVPDPDSESLIFHVPFTGSFLNSLFASLVLSLPTLAPVILFYTMSTEHFISELTHLLVVQTIACAVLCLLLTHLLPVVINKTELRSANAWAIPARVNLAEISSIKNTNFLTLRYLKVSTHKKKNVLWIPLFLSDMEGFRAAVAEYTLPDNPLRIALES